MTNTAQQMTETPPDQAVTHTAHFSEVAAHTDGASVANYKGLPIYALPELHGFMASKASQYVPQGAKMLELAAGSGALTQRLMDHGFDVIASDLVTEGFRLHGQAPFVTMDLNQPFADDIGAPFDAISALEIIEHLENPRHFLRQCYGVLKPGGILLLSTPNIENPRSVLRFVSKGEFRQFSDSDYDTSGHITPVGQWQLRKMIAEGGWELLEFTSCGQPYGAGFRHLSAKLLAWLWMRRNPAKRGAITVAILKKPA